MAYKTITNGVIFIEGSIENFQPIRTVEYEKNSFYNSQLKNLDEVKSQLAQKARASCANCIVNFKYGQKSMGFFKSWLLSFDDNVEWYANGLAGSIPEELYNSIVSEINKR